MKNPIDWCRSHLGEIKTSIDLLAKIATILTVVAIFIAYKEFKILDEDRRANITLPPPWKFKNDGEKDSITFAYENNGFRIAKDVKIEIAINEKIQDIPSDNYMIDLNPSE